MIEKFVKHLGERISYLYFVLVNLIFLDVLIRFLTDKSQIWIGELEWQIFALLFLIGMSYALQSDKHVRVDLFYNKFKPKTQNVIDVIGHLIFLIPWCMVVIYTSYKYAAN
nr:TRAP transporter small permease subunit [Saprospiraceae bacterium]